MLYRFVDDLKASAGSAMRQTSLAAIAAISLFITTAFLCGAAFVAVLNHYGPVTACLAGAAIFFVVTLIAAGIYLVRKRRIEARAAARAKAATQNLFADPALLASGIQLVRLVGVKRLVPILAIGGLALGLMAGRSHAAADQTPAE
jgi:hypothetical protein